VQTGRTILILAVLSLLSGCAALPTPVVLGPDSFKGMTALIEPEAQGQPLHVLIIHGMGTPAPYDREEFIRSLADRFGLVQKLPIPTAPQPQGCYPVAPAKEALVHPAPRLIPIDRATENAWARLYTYNFARTQSGPRKLIVSYLLWAPLTETIKCGLAPEQSRARPVHSYPGAALRRGVLLEPCSYRPADRRSPCRSAAPSASRRRRRRAPLRPRGLTGAWRYPEPSTRWPVSAG